MRYMFQLIRAGGSLCELRLNVLLFARTHMPRNKNSVCMLTEQKRVEAQRRRRRRRRPSKRNVFIMCS